MNFDFRPLYHKFFPSQDAKWVGTYLKK
jgi:hypothetical protein